MPEATAELPEPRGGAEENVLKSSRFGLEELGDIAELVVS
jgi:hypothetical protein